MTDQQKSRIDQIRAGMEFGVALLLLPIALFLLKAWEIPQESHRVRTWMVRNGYLTFEEPPDEAIEKCSECGYRGTLAVDKHRYAPASQTNLEIRCPDCRQTIEGPITAERAAEYINLCRPHDGAEVMALGPTAQIPVISNHLKKWVLSEKQIAELTRAAEVSADV